MDNSNKNLRMTNSGEIAASDMIVLQNFLNENESNNNLWQETISPLNLGFIPHSNWVSSKPMTISSLHETYFSKKNSVSRRFEHKLWNALKITTSFPNLVKVIGVTWLNNRTIKVYKHPFARLLNISCVDGGLFHKQGNFTRHGFVEMAELDARNELTQEQMADVDFRDVHLIYHQNGEFTTDSTEVTICSCRWVDPSPTPRVAALKIGNHNDHQSLE